MELEIKETTVSVQLPPDLESFFVLLWFGLVLVLSELCVKNLFALILPDNSSLIISVCCSVGLKSINSNS